MNVPIGRYCLRLFPSGAPTPVGRIAFFRKLSYGIDPLTARFRSLRQHGKELSNKVLSEALAGDEMGLWSMSPATMNFLESEIHKHKPRAILELSSGLSTICLAQYMRELYRDSKRTFVVSLEQDQDVAQRTLERLRLLGTAPQVRIFHAPLVSQQFEGVSVQCYSAPVEFANIMESLTPDFAVIDGPASKEGRFGTVPLIRPYVSPKTRFYLDDALRDSEIEIATRWNRLPYVRLHGVHLTEKGMLLGEIQGDA